MGIGMQLLGALALGAALAWLLVKAGAWTMYALAALILWSATWAARLSDDLAPAPRMRRPAPSR